jgi:hypothetical protein
MINKDKLIKLRQYVQIKNDNVSSLKCLFGEHTKKFSTIGNFPSKDEIICKDKISKFILYLYRDPFFFR